LGAITQISLSIISFSMISSWSRFAHLLRAMYRSRYFGYTDTLWNVSVIVCRVGSRFGSWGHFFLWTKSRKDFNYVVGEAVFC
jgi:hypothetical protein